MNLHEPSGIDAADRDGIDSVCRQFDSELRSGSARPLEQYLEPLDERLREAAFRQLLQLEVDHQRAVGSSPRAGDYLARYPRFAQVIDEVFQLRPSAASGATPAAQEETTIHHDTDAAPYFASRAPTIARGPMRYRILRPHARGGLGEVSVAQDEELSREVALKEIRQEFAQDEGCRSRFLLEARVTGGLEHPGIVPVYSCGEEHDGRIYYAMRFVRGEDLKDAVDRYHAGRDAAEAEADEQSSTARALAFRDLLRRFVDVCNAIAYAHSRGVLHRDIKPGNIMLGKYGETLVVDWGLAKPMGQAPPELKGQESQLPLPLSDSSMNSTRMGEAIGTPGYMSPEQAAGRWDAIGPPSDVFSLGATLYAVLTGVPPYHGRRSDEMMRKVRSAEVTPPREVRSDVPKPLEAICLKAMAADPAARYATAQELASDVELWMADEPVRAYAEPWRDRVRRWTRKHRTLMASGLATLLMALVSGLIGIALLSRANDQLVQANDRAQQYLGDVDAAVDQYFTRISKEELLNEPGLQHLRQQLLSYARSHYEQVLARGSSDPEPLAKAARAQFNLAVITQKIGTESAAIEDFNKCLSTWGQVAARRALSAEEARELAEAHAELAFVQQRAGRGEESVASYQLCLATLDELLEQAPDHADYLYDKARAHQNLGLTYWEMGQHTEALSARRTALAVADSLVQLSPAQAGHRELQASIMYSLSVHAFDAGQLDECLDYLERCQQTLESLCQEYPRSYSYQLRLARVHNHRGVALAVRNRHAQAGLEMDIARRILEEAVGFNSLVSELRNELAIVYSNIGSVHIESGREEDAAAAVRKALQLSRELYQANPNVLDIQRSYGMACARAANLKDIPERMELAEQGVAMISKVLEATPDNHRTLLLLAESLAHLGSLQSEQGDLSEARQSLQDAWSRLRQESVRYPDDPWARRLRSVCCARFASSLAALGDARALAELADQNRQLAGDEPFELVISAQYFAQAAALAWQRARQSDDEQAKSEWADISRRAVAALAEADARGLRQSAAFWEGFASQFAGDAWRAVMANAEAQQSYKEFLEAANAQVRGDWRADVAGDRMLIQFFQRQSDLFPLMPEFRLGISIMAREAAITCQQNNDAEQAAELLQTAIAAVQAIDRTRLDDSVKDDSALSDEQFARNYMDLAIAITRSRGYLDAKEFFEKAIAIWESKRNADFQPDLRQARELVRSVLSKLTVKLSPDSKRNLAECLAYMGSVVRRQGQFDEARQFFQRSIKMYRELAWSHEEELSYQLGAINSVNNLGLLYMQFGRYDDAEASFQKGLDEVLQLQRDGRLSEQWRIKDGQDRMAEVEALRETDRQVDLMLDRQVLGASAPQLLELAEFCALRRPADAVRLYRTAFALAPEQAEDREHGRRYNAACAAAYAAAGGAELDEAARRELSDQALQWLEQELNAWRQAAAGDEEASRQVAREILPHWQQDPLLESVRPETAPWRADPSRMQKLWRSVEDLRRQLLIAEGAR